MRNQRVKLEVKVDQTHVAAALFISISRLVSISSSFLGHLSYVPIIMFVLSMFPPTSFLTQANYIVELVTPETVFPY